MIRTVLAFTLFVSIGLVGASRPWDSGPWWFFGSIPVVFALFLAFAVLGGRE